MILDPRLGPQRWAFIYRAWTLWSYAVQAFGIIWILWGGGLTIWALGTQDLSRLTALSVLVLIGALVVPSTIMYFGAARFRAWVRKRSATLQVRGAD